MTEMTVLDVGHGNSAILRSAGQVAVVDAPTRSLLLDTLRDMAIETVDVAFISHADKDHLAGIVGLLTSKTVRVNTLYLNVDANRRSRLWRDLLAAVAVAQAQGSCKVVTSLSSTTPGRVDVGDARIHVVAPSASLTLTGVGGRTQDDQLVTANSLSAVLRVEHQDERSGVLLAGDMDEIGLKDAVASNADVRARVLVFPHHGGSPDGDTSKFARAILDAVQPSTVIFSNGRNRHENPQPGIVEATLAAKCAIACTQMAKNCSAKSVPGDHLEEVRAHGRKENLCCAGSITFTLNGGAHRQSSHGARFDAFVESAVSTPMCRRRIN